MILPGSANSIGIGIGAAAGGLSYTEDVSQTSAGSTSTLGAGSFQRQSQGFQVSDNWTQLRISLPWYLRSGATGGSCNLYLYNFSVGSGTPTTLVSTYSSNPVSYTDFPSSDPLPSLPTQFIFTGLSLTASNYYAIVAFHNAGSGTDGVLLPVDTGNPYAGGNQAFDFSGGGTWTAAFTNDLAFSVEGAIV